MVFPVGMYRCEVKIAQSCPTLCDPMDCSLPGSSVHGIFQATVLEWVAISFSRASARPRDWIRISCIDRRILYHCATWEANPMIQNVFIGSWGNQSLGVEKHCLEQLTGDVNWRWPLRCLGCMFPPSMPPPAPPTPTPTPTPSSLGHSAGPPLPRNFHQGQCGPGSALDPRPSPRSWPWSLASLGDLVGTCLIL